MPAPAKRPHQRTPRKAAAQDRSRATVQAILEATSRILVTEGYEAATTNALARAAGVSVGSLYQYFPNRESIVAELMDRAANRAFGLLMERISGLSDAPPEVVLRAVTKAVFAAFAEDAPLNKVLLQHLVRVGRLDKLLEMEARAAQVIRLYLDSIRDRVVVRNTEVASLLIVHLADTMTHSLTLFHDDLVRSDALGDEIADMVVRYLLGSNGKTGA